MSILAVSGSMTFANYASGVSATTYVDAISTTITRSIRKLNLMVKIHKGMK